MNNPAAETRKKASPESLSRLAAASHLYGRSRETHALSMALRRAAAGGAELIVLSGPAGIGKTSLVQHMRLPVGQQHGYFISGKFDQLQRDVPFSAIVSALQDLVRQLLTESQAQTRAWRDAIVSAVGRNGRVITEVIPALERIIGPQPPLAVLEPAESQNRFNHVFQNFLQVFCRENRPLVVFLDDVHWADPASLRLLTSLLSSAGTHSLLLIASCRDNEVVATHPFMLALKELERRAVPVHTVQVAALGWSDITQFIGDALHVEGDVAAPLAETIREKTGGNPFFMRQFLQKLQAEGLLDFDAASGSFHCDLAAIRNLAITENVADLVAQKIGRLDAATQRVVSYRCRDRQSLRSRDARQRGRVHAGTGARTAVGGGTRPPAARAGNRRRKIRRPLLHVPARPRAAGRLCAGARRGAPGAQSQHRARAARRRRRRRLGTVVRDRQSHEPGRRA